MFRHIKLKLMLALCLASNPFSMANAEDAYCAVVKIEIQQELSLERQAFDAVMKINNGLDTLPIEDVSISVNFQDENGDPVLATTNPNDTDPNVKFFIRVDAMNGINNIDGTGVVAPSTSAEIRWLIIPSTGAAEGFPGGKLYFVGAHLSYTLGGVQEAVDVIPDFITVKPLPQLSLDYFLTKDVVGDDPFTSPEIEAPEPYTLGVRIKNTGTGVANNIKIDSAQPKIVANEQGLLIDFKITGSTVNDQPAQPTLLIDFGTIDSGEATVGRWIMETSLLGIFTEFTAKISHADELGGAVTSIIDANDINTHFLLRDVKVDLPGRDNVRDFLATTNTSLKVYESEAVDTAVNNVSSGATFTLTSQSGTTRTHALTMSAQPGFNYAQIEDPYSGQKIVTSAVRSDGKVILPENAWASKTRDRVNNVWLYWVNIFDVDSTGNYMVTMDDNVIGPLPPVIQAISDKVTYEGNQVGFLVESSDPNGDAVTMTAGPLPAGATFVDNFEGVNGRATFNWTPSVGQAGTYLITYTSFDGVLTSQRTATIRVNPASDTDGDGMDDDWEMSQFGSLDNDGLGDADSDGISDLDEFLDGTDPNLAPPAAPNDLVGVSGNLQATLNWSDVTGATGYRAYWSETPDVTKLLGYPVDDVLSPFSHTGLTNDTPYYYAVASIGPGGESDLSTTVTVIPGVKNWGTPMAVENSANNISDDQIAFAGNGTAMAIWVETDSGNSNLFVNLYSLDTGWAIPTMIHTTSENINPSSVRIKMDEYGNAIVAWKQSNDSTDSLLSLSYSVSSGWGTVLQAVAKPVDEIRHGRFVLTNSGAAMAIWTQTVSGGSIATEVWTSILYANASAWTIAEQIDTTSGEKISRLRLSNDNLGNVMAVWAHSSDDGASYNISFNRFANSTWGTEQIIRSGMVGYGTQAVKPDLAVNSQGDAIISWTEVGAINDVMAMRYTITGGWETPALLELDDVNPAFYPAVAISDTGDAIIAWVQARNSTSAIYSNRYTAGAGWGASSTLISSDATGDPVGTATPAKVGMDNSGNVVVVWQQLDSLQSNIWSNRYDIITGWDDPIIIENGNDGNNAINPRLAVDASGNAVATWIYYDGVSNLLSNDLNSTNTGMPNILPIVRIPVSANANADEAVVIDGSASFDQDGFIALYEWSQVSGSVVQLNGQNTHTLNFTAPALAVAETLVFRLTVTDGDGATGSRDISVSVNAQPQVDAGIEQTVNETDGVNLTGTASDNDGTIVSYSWTQTAGTTVTLTGADTTNASFTAPYVPQNETLSFSFTVTDDKGSAATDTINISVVSGDNDSDGLSNYDEVITYGTNPDLIDTDGDGISDLIEVTTGTDPLQYTVNGDINSDGSLNVSDVLLIQQHILGTITLDANQVLKADIYPAGSPDGLVTVSDLLLIQQLVLSNP